VIAQSPGGLDVGRAVAIVEQLAATLDAAHASGLVHGDIRPVNVRLVHESGRETARLSDAQPRPAAEGFDARADVYGLGALLFEMLTGRGPFTGAPARAIDLRPGLPAAFEPVFARALAQEPHDRYGPPASWRAPPGPPRAAATRPRRLPPRRGRRPRPRPCPCPHRRAPRKGACCGCWAGSSPCSSSA
jgi:serine/threonine protein kinase